MGVSARVPSGGRLALVFASATLLFVGIVVLAERPSLSATPHSVTARFMGFNLTGTAIAFQPSGASVGTSYGWSSATEWQSADGTWHDGGLPTCTAPTDRGRTIVTIGVVTAQPVGDAPGTDLIAWLKC